MLVSEFWLRVPSGASEYLVYAGPVIEMVSFLCTRSHVTILLKSAEKSAEWNAPKKLLMAVVCGPASGGVGSS